MSCPKCATQNADETKFCRGCGADISRVLPAIAATPATGHPTYSGGDSKSPRQRIRSSAFRLSEMETGEGQTIAERYVDLLGRGWRGLLVGGGFLIVAALTFGISERLAVLGIFL